jgi:hypothetical protein
MYRVEAKWVSYCIVPPTDGACTEVTPANRNEAYTARQPVGSELSLFCLHSNQWEATLEEYSSIKSAFLIGVIMSLLLLDFIFEKIHRFFAIQFKKLIAQKLIVKFV